MSDKLSDFPEYASQVLLRLEEGARQYGDKSFGRPAPEILGELEQEVLDVLGWGYVLWQRMRKLRGELASYERMRELLDSREETIVEMQLEIDRLKSGK